MMLISEQQIRQARAKVDQTKRVLEINQACLKMSREETMPTQLAQTEAAVRKAESLYKLKQKQVESLHVRAGTAGILAQIPTKIEPGQSVAVGTIVGKITNPKKLKAQLKVPEAQARDVTIGLVAEVDTHHGTVLGKVVRIDPTVMDGNVTVDVSLNGGLAPGRPAGPVGRRHDHDREAGRRAERRPAGLCLLRRPLGAVQSRRGRPVRRCAAASSSAAPRSARSKSWRAWKSATRSSSATCPNGMAAIESD